MSNEKPFKKRVALTWRVSVKTFYEAELIVFKEKAKVLFREVKEVKVL